MRRPVEAWIILAISLTMLAGCGKPSGQAADASQTGGRSANSQAPDGPLAAGRGCVNPPQDMDGPEGAVCQFLEAIRVGDDQTTEAMFVSAGRQKIRELKIPVTRAGSDTARFDLGPVERVSDDLVRVGCKWTDLDADGTHTDEMVWAVLKEPDGWRIAGLAATVFDGEPPLVLDFQDPEEVVEKLDMLRQEVARRMALEADPAQRPDDGGPSIQR